MTINVALATSGAVVLGCDSIASVSQPLLDPFANLERGEDGAPIVDQHGRMTAKFSWTDVKSTVTQIHSGVTKIFPVCEKGARVAATTAGLAALSGKSMQNLAAEFCRQISFGPAQTSVQAVADKFLTFIRDEYDTNYGGSNVPDVLKDDIEFLLGGYGPGDYFPSIYRVTVRDKTAALQYGPGSYGVAWAGQSDGVSRLIFGYDQLLQRRAHRAGVKTIDAMYKSFSEATAAIVEVVLKKLEATMPEGVDMSLPDKPKIDFPWKEFELDIECQNLPLQDAIDLVSYLVYLQAGRAKFVRGVPTVGGRIRIGYMTRDSDFVLINEPEILHRITGFPVHV